MDRAASARVALPTPKRLTDRSKKRFFILDRHLRESDLIPARQGGGPLVLSAL